MIRYDYTVCKCKSCCVKLASIGSTAPCNHRSASQISVEVPSIGPYPCSGLLGPTGLPQISTGVSWPWLGPPKGSSLIPALQAYGDGFKNSHHISWTDLDSINVNESNDGKSATYSLQLNLVNIFPPLSTGGWRNKYVDRVTWHCGICIICIHMWWCFVGPPSTMINACNTYRSKKILALISFIPPAMSDLWPASTSTTTTDQT